jgi:hypothetical protein
MKNWIGPAAVVALLLLAGAAKASWPCGIYARIDKVEMGPDADRPSWVKVWGDFLLVKTSERLVGPERGYMYFSLVQGKEDLCRLEWEDLKEIAGSKNHYVAFGSAFTERRDDLAGEDDRPNVHPADAQDARPIPYPLDHGLSRLRTREDVGQESPVGKLQKYLEDHPLEKP